PLYGFDLSPRMARHAVGRARQVLAARDERRVIGRSLGVRRAAPEQQRRDRRCCTVYPIRRAKHRPPSPRQTPDRFTVPPGKPQVPARRGSAVVVLTTVTTYISVSRCHSSGTRASGKAISPSMASILSARPEYSTVQYSRLSIPGGITEKLAYGVLARSMTEFMPLSTLG